MIDRPAELAQDATTSEAALLHALEEIAAELGLSTRTIEDRRAKLMKKMDAGCLAELIQLVMTR